MASKRGAVVSPTAQSFEQDKIDNGAGGDMKRRTARTEIGLGWYRREDWDRLLEIEKFVKREGNITKRIIVDPDELAARCAMRGREPIASARAEYICEKMTQAAAPTASR
jgi:hypothetical protein